MTRIFGFPRCPPPTNPTILPARALPASHRTKNRGDDKTIAGRVLVGGLLAVLARPFSRPWFAGQAIWETATMFDMLAYMKQHGIRDVEYRRPEIHVFRDGG